MRNFKVVRPSTTIIAGEVEVEKVRASYFDVTGGSLAFVVDYPTSQPVLVKAFAAGQWLTVEEVA